MATLKAPAESVAQTVGIIRAFQTSASSFDALVSKLAQDLIAMGHAKADVLALKPMTALEYRAGGAAELKQAISEAGPLPTGYRSAWSRALDKLDPSRAQARKATRAAKGPKAETEAPETGEEASQAPQSGPLALTPELRYAIALEAIANANPAQLSAMAEAVTARAQALKAPAVQPLVPKARHAERKTARTAQPVKARREARA